MQSLLDELQSFVYYNYINPIVLDSGYNPINTLTLALAFGVVLFGMLRLLKYLQVDVSERFILAVSPYILVGSIFRVIEDAEVFSAPLRYLFITPLIHILVFIIAIIILAASVYAHKRGFVDDYHMPFATAGIIWALIGLFVLLYREPVRVIWAPLAITGLTAAITALIYTAAFKFDLQFLSNKLNITILGAHLLDACSTYIGVDYLGYHAKHVIEQALIKNTGSALGMIALKIMVFIPILYLLQHYFTEEDRELKNLALLAILMLGLAPGLRNMLRMTLGI